MYHLSSLLLLSFGLYLSPLKPEGPKVLKYVYKIFPIAVIKLNFKVSGTILGVAAMETQFLDLKTLG